jgi:hypothetical protein
MDRLFISKVSILLIIQYCFRNLYVLISKLFTKFVTFEQICFF